MHKPCHSGASLTNALAAADSELRRRVFDAFRLSVSLDRNARQIHVKALVSSAFGMNVAFFGFNQPEGLYLALALMIAPTLALVVWMRRKGWLGRPHAARK